MNKLCVHSWIISLSAVMLTAFPLCAAEFNLDDGTTADGDMLLPKTVAMRCGISSADAADQDKINECLNKIAADTTSIDWFAKQTMHQVNKDALNIALKYKTDAGDYEETMDEKLGDNTGIQSGSAAAGGDIAADGDDLRKDQSKNAKIYSRGAENLNKIIAVYTTNMGIDAYENFFESDASFRNDEQREAEQ